MSAMVGGNDNEVGSVVSCIMGELVIQLKVRGIL